MFGFPKVEHKKFKKNFLKTVIFQLSFDKISLIEEKSNQIKELIIKRFPRFNSSVGKGFQISFTNENDPSFKKVENSQNLEFRSLDGNKILQINEYGITFTISGKEYKSFSDTKEELKKINQILDVCEVDSVIRTAIRKINIVEFKKNENPSEILNFLLNQNLIGNLDFFPKREYINHCIQSLNYNIENNFLNVKYGLNIPPQPNQEIGQLIIDIDLYNQKRTETVNFVEVFEDINNEIFNIFHWVVNDNTLKLLDE